MSFGPDARRVHIGLHPGSLEEVSEGPRSSGLGGFRGFSVLGGSEFQGLGWSRI